jgi:TolB-like protein/Tfp pilus assembly protein PilF
VRVAVLPFTDLSERQDGYFSDGLTEEMISQLGRLSRDRIGVISRTSSMHFRNALARAREIGEALHADYLLEGSVRHHGDRARITARLVHAKSETHLWVETYEPLLTDYLSVQMDVAQRIARSLAVELDPDERIARKPVSNNAAAYHAYLQGRYYWNMLADSGVDQALAYLERAVQLDPSCAPAHAGLARARLLQAEYYDAPPQGALEAARRSATRAVELDPTLFEAHLALGDVRRLLEWDWRGAEDAYSQAITLNPSHEGPHRAYGLLLASLSRSDEAIRESERACEMDPLCAVVYSSGAAWIRFLARDYDTAISRARVAVEMEPTYVAARRILAAAYLQSGRGHDAIAELEAAMAMADDDPVLIAALAHARALTGDSGAARDLLNKLTRHTGGRHVASYHLALAHVGLLDTDDALAALEQGLAERDPALTNLAVDPRFDPIRADPRFGRLTQQLAL